MLTLLNNMVSISLIEDIINAVILTTFLVYLNMFIVIGLFSKIK